MINESGKYYYLDADGNVIEGQGNPAAVSVLAAPGATVPDDIVQKYDLADRLRAGGDSAVQTDAAGRPVVVQGGRALAADLLAPGQQADPKHNTQGTVEAVRQQQQRSAAGAKAVRSGVTEDKGGPPGPQAAPSAPQDKPAPPK